MEEEYRMLEEDREQFNVLLKAVVNRFGNDFDIKETDVTGMTIYDWNMIVRIKNAETFIELYEVSDSDIWHLRKSIIFHDKLFASVLDELEEIFPSLI